MAQLAGAQGCIAQPDESSEAYRGCGRGRGLIDPNDVSVAGDGRNLYVAASGAGAVASFERESGSGRIAEVNCVSANGTSGVDGTEHACADGDALAQAAAVTVSHDGMFVYASSYASSGIAIFARSEATGALKQVGCVRAVRTCVSARALGGASALAISPDGLNAYLAASEADAVSQFTRDPSNGLLSPLGCISDDGTDRLCVNGNALRGADAVAISPDGKNVYIAAATSNAVLSFARDARSGALKQTGCIMDTAPRRGSCVPGRAMSGIVSLTISADGRTLFGAAYDSDALVVFARNPVSGSISEVGCVSQPPEEGDSNDGCAHASPMISPTGVAMSPDGTRVFVSVESGLTGFERDTTTGGLKPLGCLTYAGYYDDAVTKKCALANGIANASDVALSPDGRNVYVTSWDSDAVAVFAPGISFTAAQPVSRYGTLAVQLTCPRLHEGGCQGRLTLRALASRTALTTNARYTLDQGRSGVVPLPLRHFQATARPTRANHPKTAQTEAVATHLGSDCEPTCARTRFP
jgi:6-phosphogluconolactonase (cycloisomerase 2 family)